MQNVFSRNISSATKHALKILISKIYIVSI